MGALISLKELAEIIWAGQLHEGWLAIMEELHCATRGPK
jgi:hypothetical protein